MSSETSLTLLEQLRLRPDGGPWQRLVDLYTPLLQTWLRRHFLPDADVDDLVQEVLAVVVRELPRFEHNNRPGAFRAWLRGILVHRLRDFWRRQDYRPEATGNSDFQKKLEELEAPDTGLGRLWDQEHNQHVVARLLEMIRPQFQPTTWQAFRAVMLGGERPAAAAARLGISVNAVLLAKSRVLRSLRLQARGLVD
jgi:RNA polymerase sigma-70 factor (ECF subfamily)